MIRSVRSLSGMPPPHPQKNFRLDPITLCKLYIKPSLSEDPLPTLKKSLRDPGLRLRLGTQRQIMLEQSVICWH